MCYYHLGGTQRSRIASDTLKWLQPKLSKIGITRVANVTGLDNIGIFITTSIRPNARHLSVSQGKGISLELSKISAIMESMEGYHVEVPPPINIEGTYSSLQKKYHVANPTLFANGPFIFKNLEQYSMGWILAEELNSKEQIYIPHALTCLDSTHSKIEFGFFNITTNGLAAGNTIEEALCHALYELIERDNLSRLQNDFFDLEKSQIKLSSINDKINRNLINKLQSALQVAIWDITGPLDIPTFHVAIWKPNDPLDGRVYTGTGTHLQKEIALSRALTEAAQSRLTIITGIRDDIFPEYYNFSYAAALNNQQNQIKEGSKIFKSCNQPNSYNSFTDNIIFLRKRLIKFGYTNIYFINHTKPDIDVPVVQLFVPGLKVDLSRI